MIVNVFEKTEILNTALQNSQFSVNKSHEKVTFIATSLQDNIPKQHFLNYGKKVRKR